MQNNLVPFVEFRGVGKQYDGKYAVSDLDLTIYEGEFFVLVGGSGSGKSTTLLNPPNITTKNNPT